MANLKKRTKALLVSSTVLLSTAIVSLSTFTLGKYVESKSVVQEISRMQMENYSYFLNANVWNTGTDGANPPKIVESVYYMWVITGGSSGYLISPIRHVTPQVSGTTMDLYVFEYKYEWAAANRKFVFIRANPNVSITNFTTWPSTATWNQTCDIDYNGERNYYCIKGWSGATGGKSEYEYNRIVKSSGLLYWGNPSGSSTTIYN